MHRAAVTAIVLGCALGEIAAGGGQAGTRARLPDVAMAAEVQPASGQAAKPDTVKTVTYDGHTVSVPASWPVYRLDRNPQQCVRYDIHAVYLGTPGPDQNCPPGLVGRTQTVSISAAGVSVTSPAVASAPFAPGSSTETAPTANGAANGAAAVQHTTMMPRAADTSRLPLAGFDTCTAPSLPAMKAWRSKYAAVGIYIGGQDMACDYGNLSASWVRSARAMGWSLLPLYVGLQAPCTSYSGRINAKDAAAQGKAAADDAITDAGAFGLGQDTPVYYDMEAYNTANASCRTAVLAFLSAWTAEMHARDYISGVYSSASAAIEDLASTSTVNGRPLAEPDAVWFALWDGKRDLDGTPYLPGSAWASERTKQYTSGHTQKIGGYTLNIDSDWVGGAMAGP